MPWKDKEKRRRWDEAHRQQRQAYFRALRAFNLDEHRRVSRENQRCQRADSLLRKIYDEWRTTACVDCGKVYQLPVMQADHRDPNTKRATVSSLVDIKWTPEREARLRDELSLCDPVCANCHALRTHMLRHIIAKKVSAAHRGEAALVVTEAAEPTPQLSLPWMREDESCA